MEAEKEIKSKSVQIAQLEDKLREAIEKTSELKKTGDDMSIKNDELRESNKSHSIKILELMNENSLLSKEASDLKDNITTLEATLVFHPF